MEFILFILKIIFIFILIVLGLIFFAVSVILFVPVRYQISGSIDDAGEVSVKGTLSYLLSIFKLFFCYEQNQFKVTYFFFGKDRQKKAQIQEETKKEKENEAETQNVQVFKTFQQNEKTNETEEIQQEKPVTLAQSTNSFETTQKRANAPQHLEEKNTTEKKHFQSEKKRRTKRTFKKTELKKPKIEKIKENVSFLKQQLTDEHHKAAIRKIWSEFQYVWRHFKFRKIKTDLIFSMGDPAATGQIVGIISIIPFIYRYDITLVPDFDAENIYIKGTFDIAGRMRGIHLLVAFCRLIFHKDVKLVIRKIQATMEKKK